MNQTPAPPPLAAFEIRMASHLAIGFVLDVADVGRQVAPLLDCLLLSAIIDANVSRVLRDPALQATYARLDTPQPDALRRPVSINAIAESLGLPFETVRRHVRQYVARGACAVTPQGVYVPGEVIGSPVFAAMQKVRYTRVLRFHADLLAVGAVEPLPFTPPPADDPRAPVHAVGRLLSDYFFRSLGSLKGQVRDPLSGLILLQILQMGSEHIPLQQHAGVLREGRISDDLRARVRAAQVARRLRTPYETTRRHIGWLVEDGLCHREDGGLLVSEAVLQAPQMQALLYETQKNIHRMFRGFAALGGEFTG